MDVCSHEVTCEIRHGNELSFEEVGGVEEKLREALEELLRSCDPSYVDFRATGDDFGFVSSLRGAEPEDLKRVCRELASIMDQGARGRLVAVEQGFGPVRVIAFSPDSLEELVFPS